MHVDEDFTQLAVFIFACAQIDLVTANNRFLGVALATVWQAAAFTACTFDDALNNAFCGDGAWCVCNLLRQLSFVIYKRRLQGLA